MSKICSNCGNVVEDSCVVCNRCGASPDQAAVQQQPPVQQAAYQPAQEETTPSLGMWVGFLLLASIPTVGLIILIVIACGGITKSTAMKNWAIAMLIFKGISIVLAIVIAVVSIIGGAAFISDWNSMYETASLLAMI